MAAVQQNTTYAQELLAGDLVAITSEILEIGERKIQFRHKMVECLTGDAYASTAFTLIVQCVGQLPFPTILEQSAGACRGYRRMKAVCRLPTWLVGLTTRTIRS